jgi:hypothetical protein
VRGRAGNPSPAGRSYSCTSSQTIQRISIMSNSRSTDSMSTVGCNAFRGAYDKQTGRAPWKRQVKTAVERLGVMRCTATVRGCIAAPRRASFHHSYRFRDPVTPRRRIRRRELLSLGEAEATRGASPRSRRSVGSMRNSGKTTSQNRRQHPSHYQDPDPRRNAR